MAAGGHAQPIYLYDHSGLTVSTRRFSDAWDSGQLGWIAIEREKLEKLGLKGDDAERIKEIVESEMKTWDQYLTGEVYAVRRYGVSIDNNEFAHETGEEERVHGFLRARKHRDSDAGIRGHREQRQGGDQARGGVEEGTDMDAPGRVMGDAGARKDERHSERSQGNSRQATGPDGSREAVPCVLRANRMREVVASRRTMARR